MAHVSLFPILGRRWWMLLLRGITAVLFGLLAFAWPGLTIVVLTAVFAAYALVDGMLALVAGIQARWWSVAIFGAVGVLAGLIAFLAPGLTALTLLFLIAAWAIVRGVLEIAAAIHLRKAISNEWMLIIGGVCSVVFGLILFAQPGSGALAVIWIIGAYSLVIGIFLIILSLRIKSHHHALASI